MDKNFYRRLVFAAMIQIISIGVGGFFGAISRFLVSGWIHHLAGVEMPYGTLVVNVAGSFILAFLLHFFLSTPNLPVAFKGALTTGFLGAFTTFSTFTVDTLYLFEHGSWSKAVLNILLNVLICLVAASVGLALAKMFN